MTDIRTALGTERPYWTINREERNYAALLYYVLLTGDNLERFLDSIDYNHAFRPEEVAAYVEYAYIRDTWAASNASGEDRRKVITDLLATDDVRALADASTLEWNKHFGVGTPVASNTIVQSPSRWSMSKFHPNIASDQDFLATCKFKWAFNIKPDLVIHTTNEHAVVIETKYASGEGSYPASSAEKAIFSARGLKPVGQAAMQEYMFRHLLGIEATYLYVVKDPNAAVPTHERMLWSELFDALDTSSVPPFVRGWLRTLAQ